MGRDNLTEDLADPRRGVDVQSRKGTGRRRSLLGGVDRPVGAQVSETCREPSRTVTPLGGDQPIRPLPIIPVGEVKRDSALFTRLIDPDEGWIQFVNPRNNDGHD